MTLHAIEHHLRESQAVKERLQSQTEAILSCAKMLVSAVQQGGRIYACGNGGSSCDAMHFVEELVARYHRERPGIPAHHLCDVGTITCWSNDYQYDSVFARQVETLTHEKDVLVLFSTSGNSKNIILAVEAAKKIGAKTIGLLGKGGGAVRSMVDLALVVPSEHTAHIQEAHITLVHIFCEHMETELFRDRD